MNLNITHLLSHSTHLLQEKVIFSIRHQQRNIVVVALIALGCLAACLYLFWRRTPSETLQIDKKIPPENPKKASKPIPQKREKKVEKVAELLQKAGKVAETISVDSSKTPEEEVLDIQKQDQEIDPTLPEKEESDREFPADVLLENPLSKPLFRASEKDEIQDALLMSLVPLSHPETKAVPKTEPKPLSVSKSEPNLMVQSKTKSAPVDDDADLLAAVKESQKESQPKRAANLKPASKPPQNVQTEDDADLLAAIKESQREAQQKQAANSKPESKPASKPQHNVQFEDDADLLAAIKESEKEAQQMRGANSKPQGVQVDTDAELLAVIQQSQKEAQQKQDLELKKALELSRKNAPVLGSPVNPLPVGAAVLSPLSKIPQKKKPALDEDLLKTTQAKSESSAESLEKAVEKAKQNKRLRISKHEIKRNEGGNAFLVLHFASEVHRNLAVEELRTKYAMFQAPTTPSRVGTTILELTVEQSIAFENKF